VAFNANDTVQAAALDVLEHTEVIGDLLMKRAHHAFINTPHPDRTRRAKARKPISASGRRPVKGATTSFGLYSEGRLTLTRNCA
jgi:hypothetical protein